MTSLSSLLNEKVISSLKNEVLAGKFPGITFEQAMQFLLSDGVLPASGLPVQSFIRLEDWIFTRGKKTVTFTTTELKNKTGQILELVLQGKIVRLEKHGRAIAELKSIEEESR